MKEMAEKPDAVKLLVRICIVQLLQDLQLLETCLVHHLVVADNLDGYFLVGFQGVSRSDHVTEHTLSGVAVDSVASV